MEHALGISVHTGWAACVVVGGSLRKPEIVANEIIEMLGDAERFCFHMAAEMKPAEAESWIARKREKAPQRLTTTLQEAHTLSQIPIRWRKISASKKTRSAL